MYFRNCVRYYVTISIVAFILGRIVPKHWMRWDVFPFRSAGFEKNGKIYERIGIRYWQKKVPDMSKMFPFLMPPKSMKGDYQSRLPLMIQETCVAELVHGILCILGFHGLRLWPGAGGFAMCMIYVFLLNFPFLLIQRYNRPRLVRLYHRISGKTAQKVAEMSA